MIFVVFVNATGSKTYYGTQGAEGIFSVIFLLKNLEHNSGSGSWPLRPPYLNSTWLGMILILPIGISVQVRQNN